MPGQKQRTEIEASRSSKRACAETDPLSSELLTLWCNGETSAIAVQKLANAAMALGAHSTALVNFAKLGAWGQRKSNIHRDLVRLLSATLRLPAPTCIQVPCLDTKQNPPLSEASFPILLPHELIASLAKHYTNQYENLFRISEAASFWSSVNPADPRTQHNPTCTCDLRHFIPLWLHGDGVEFSTDSMLTFSWGPMLCNLSSMESCFLSAAWPKVATAGKKYDDVASTWAEVYRVIAWSFTALWHGKRPTKDWRGEPIADESAGKFLVPGGHRFCV